MRALVVVLALLMSGCVGSAPQDAQNEDPDPPLIGFGAAVLVQSGCPALRGVECFEPMVAIGGDGTLFAASGQAETIARSGDGSVWEQVPMPPLPTTAPPLTVRGDNTLQVDPQGRLWYSALVYQSILGGQNVAGLQVARSDDRGDSWAVNHYFQPAFGLTDPSPADAVVATDRQWLAFGEERVWLEYWAFMPGVTFVTSSEDDGATWAAWSRQDDVIIPGLPVVDGDDLWMPHFTFSENERVMLSMAEGPRVDVAPVDRRDHMFTMATRTGPNGWAVSFTDDAVGRVAVGSPDGWRLVDLGPSAPEPPMAFWADGVLLATWFQPFTDGNGFAVVVGRYDGNWTRVVLGEVATDRAPSDFAWLARAPDGRMAVAWADPAEGVMVAVAF